MSNRLNFPIWADADTTSTGFTLQHLVNGSWVNTDMRTCALPAGYTNEVCLNRYIEKDIKSTVPNLNYSGTTGITPQPDAYQVYRMVINGAPTLELGFFNDWSYEMFTGDTRCISAPINRHADARQHLLYGNFAETGNSIIVKEMIRPDIKMQPNSIAIGAEQYQTITIVVTSNMDFELILPEWLTASQTAFTSGTTVAYLYPQVNTSFDTRQFDILAKHEGYWEPDYEYTTLAHVAQSGKVAYLTIYPDPLGVAWDTTGLTSVTVYTNTDFTATTNSSDTWLTYSGKTEVGTNYYNVYFNVSANTGDNRQTHAYFEYVVNSSGGTYTRALRVVQAKAPDITIEPQLREIDYTAQGIRIRVESEANWTASSSESWISVPESGISGVSLIFVDVSVNTKAIMRSGSVIFNNGVKSATFNVIQEAINIQTDSIIYKSTNHSVVIPTQTGSTYYGANMISNTYYPEEDYGEIIFDGNVTTIGGGAFNYRSQISNIILPDSVTTIGNQAFGNCYSLLTIQIPSGLTSISNSAFYRCHALLSITIPDSVTSIGFSAFYRCTSLSAITIPESVTSIDYGLFENCSALSNIIIGSSVTSIGSCAFSGCTSLTSMTIPENVTIINNGVFAGCSALPSITLRNGITSIGEDSFNGCTSLTSLTIPDSVTSIGNGAFMGCTSLSAITIPESVTVISDNVFANCSALSSITMGSGVTSIGGNAFGHTGLSSITIPDSVSSIGGWAFVVCSALSSVTIGKGVTNIGTYAFSNCTTLNNIAFKGTKAQWNAITKGTNWHYNVPATKVHCSNGDVNI